MNLTMIYLFLVAVVVLNLGAVVATRGTSTAMEYDELSVSELLRTYVFILSL